MARARASEGAIFVRMQLLASGAMCNMAGRLQAAAAFLCNVQHDNAVC
jgi:hypothetical protein